MRLPRLQRLPCPLCGRALERAPGRHGLVWLCRPCRAGAATLPILRQVAPRAFVNNLWQAALHDGRVSTLICPSCMRPFTRLVGPRANARLEVCVGCFWVWLGPRALSALSGPTTGLPALAPGKAVVRRTVVSESARASAEPRHVLGVLTADVLRGAL